MGDARLDDVRMLRPHCRCAMTPSEHALFREEARAAQDEIFGGPSGFALRSWSIISAFLAIALAALVAFLVTQTYARKETVRGVLRAEGGEVRVLASRGGMLRTLYRAEGDRVIEGDILAVVSTAQLTEGDAVADEAVLMALAQEEVALDARRRAVEAAAPLDAAVISARISALDAERTAAAAAASAARARLALAQGRLEAGETLAAKGLVPAEELRRRRESVIALQQAIVDQEATATNRAAQITEHRARLSKLPYDRAQSEADLEQAVQGVKQRRAQAEAGKGYVVKASRSGRISGLQVAAGQVLDPQRPLMTIAPEGARLVADLYVPSRAIGFVEPGQRVRLLFDAFPYQRFGPGFGRVLAVSTTVLAPQDVVAAAPVGEPVYRVVVALDRPALQAFGREHPYVSGMALTADIVLEERSFAEWLLEPLYAVRRRSEPPG